ncbi:hypothetical protein [Actinomyces qiguomingii]|nr:hypothetical protein [Actinomyces qiguomingii]
MSSPLLVSGRVGMRVPGLLAALLVGGLVVMRLLVGGRRGW